VLDRAVIRQVGEVLEARHLIPRGLVEDLGYGHPARLLPAVR
jgi:hypothetical protein